jgi:hypothetical protein
LAKDEASFDGLAEPDFIGKEDPIGEGSTKSEESGFNLMGVQVHTGIEQRPGETLDA